MSVTVQWLGHASFRISGADEVIYIDPWKISGRPKDATVVLISHSHYDHYSSDDIGKVSTTDTEVFGSGDVIDKHGSGGSMKPGQTVEADGVVITAAAAYNPGSSSRGWYASLIEALPGSLSLRSLLNARGRRACASPRRP